MIAYIMNEMGFSFQHALQYVQSRRPVVKPNPNFVDQLVEYEKMLMNQRTKKKEKKKNK